MIEVDSCAAIDDAKVMRFGDPHVADDLDAQGWATIERILTRRECQDICELYDRADGFRGKVVMARHGFGKGEYQYFSYPLPDIVGGLRTRIYPWLAPIANHWNEMLRSEVRYPADHAAYLERCWAAGQQRPTPLLLKYGTGDFNCLHQDLYGEQLFPLQVAILLSEPGEEFSGGEFVLTEQRPRMQSRPAVVPLRAGDAVVFAVNKRPVRGSRGTYGVTMRHGVSALRSGRRYTLGLIFHDAA